MQNTFPFGSAAPETCGSNLTGEVSRSIRVPLAALRASIEMLSNEFSTSDPRGQLLQEAFQEVQRVGRSIQALVDYALPADVHTLRCSLAEIAHGARDALAPEKRQRCLLAVEDGNSVLCVDGPLLSRSLAHLIGEALESPTDTALLCVRATRFDAAFVVLQTRRSAEASDDSEHMGAQGELVAGLGTSVAGRDVQRLGGRMASCHLSDGSRRHEVRLPLDGGCFP